MHSELYLSIDHGEFYFHIQNCSCQENTYDYTLYHENGEEFDGGQLEECNLPIEDTAKMLVEDILEEMKYGAAYSLVALNEEDFWKIIGE